MWNWYSGIAQHIRILAFCRGIMLLSHTFNYLLPHSNAVTFLSDSNGKKAGAHPLVILNLITYIRHHIDHPLCLESRTCLSSFRCPGCTLSVPILIWHTLESIPLITGDAQLLRVISEAMRQPGRTPETVAAEIARGPNHSISQLTGSDSCRWLL